MTSSAQIIASDASLQAFVNCYLREVDGGLWHSTARFTSTSGVELTRGETHVVELALTSLGEVLALGVRFRSKVGRHTLTDVYRRRSRRAWQRLDPLSTELLLIDALYARRPDSPHRLELIGRVVESHQTMTTYVAHHLDASQRPHGETFIATERSIALGHWLHPTPKSRQGLYGWQHAHYTPELGGRFALNFFAAHRRLVRQASLLDASAETISRRLALSGPDAERALGVVTELGDDHCLVPIHPLQAQWLLHQDYVQALIATGELVDLGRLGPSFTPTSSVRTLYAETAACMIKLSMPVKITNSLRINLASELGDSVWITKLLRVCGLATEFPELVPIEDPAYITLALEGREETGFEVIFRTNPFDDSAHAGHAQRVSAIAALVQDPLVTEGRSALAALVSEVSERAGVSRTEAGHRWFDAYFRCAVASAIRIYDRHGIALEAHQQNTLLAFDDTGYPIRAYYRDIQGLALTEHCRATLIARVPELAAQPKVFEADDIVKNGLGYYLVFNQLYSVINRFALDGLLDEDVLLGVVVEKLLAMRPKMQRLGTAFIDFLLEEKAIPCKANLLTRIADMDELTSENELAVYTMVENPLCAAYRSSPYEARKHERLDAPAKANP